MEISHTKDSLVLFDIDATLLLTGGAGLRAMSRATRELFGDAFSWDGIRPHGSLDPLLLEAAAERNGVDLQPADGETFRELYIRHLPAELARFPERLETMPGVPEVLEELREASALPRSCPGLALGLLTGNYGESAHLKLRAVDIDPDQFEISVFGDEGRPRATLVELALRKFTLRYGCSIVPSRVTVVGDTPVDVEGAKTNGCRAFAVATGSFTVDELKESGADVAVEDLSDPRPLVEFLNTPGSL